MRRSAALSWSSASSLSSRRALARASADAEELGLAEAFAEELGLAGAFVAFVLGELAAALACLLRDLFLGLGIYDLTFSVGVAYGHGLRWRVGVC